MLIIVCGLPGTGKTFFSEKLSEQIDALQLSSDRIREDLCLRGNYTRESKESVYREMFRRASDELQNGRNVLLDATFSRNDELGSALDVARKNQKPAYVLEMIADDTTSLKRVSKSRKYSEADANVYESIKEEYEPIPQEHLQLDSSRFTLDDLLDRAKAYINYD